MLLFMQGIQILQKRGIEATISTPKGDLKIQSTLFGEHNLSNILSAVATAVSLRLAYRGY